MPLVQKLKISRLTFSLKIPWKESRSIKSRKRSGLTTHREYLICWKDRKISLMENGLRLLVQTLVGLVLGLGMISASSNPVALSKVCFIGKEPEGKEKHAFADFRPRFCRGTSPGSLSWPRSTKTALQQYDCISDQYMWHRISYYKPSQITHRERIKQKDYIEM